MTSHVRLNQAGHAMTMRYTALVDGQYGWQAICDCEEFMAQAPTWFACTQLCEEHIAEMMLND